MTDELVKFIEERSKLPIPSRDVARVKLLAKELVIGVHRKLWSENLQITPSSEIGKSVPWETNLKEYWSCRWGDTDISHEIKLLRLHGYVDDVLDTMGRSCARLSGAAAALIDESEPYDIFVSYRRHDSSAFALLCICRLKAEGLVPFVDMALEAGGNWHADLEKTIQQNDFFIVLLGKETLASEMTVKEIQWALQYEKTIIPVWHSGFDTDDDKWADIDTQMMDAIQQTNAIRVTDESASGYNSAIVELLNRFGVTP